MSQSGYTPIQLYRTTTAAATPTAGNLAAGELAINLTDEKLYFKNAGGTVKLLASTDTLGTVTSVAASGGTTGLTFSGSPITTSGTLTLGGTLAVANGGTGTTTAFTAGSVVFAGASGVYSQDNANLFWDNANDRLGVGTATPAYRLDVNGEINVAAGQYIRSGSAFLFASNGTSLNYIYSGSGALIWRNGADTAELMRLENGGNLLVGTTSGNGRLTVRGAGTTGSTYSFEAATSGGNTRFIVADNGQADFYNSSNALSMRIDSSGNVGIGTSNINGQSSDNRVLQIYGAGTGNRAQIHLCNSNTGETATDGSFIGVDSSSSLYISNGEGAPIIFEVNGAEQFRILSTGGITSANLADAVGYKGLPQNSQTSSYTLALSDMGKHISITTGGVVIPANASVAFPIGATIVVFNNSGSTQTISITSDTLRQAGTTNTGSRTLAVYGLATLVKVTSTVWAITGNVT